MGPDERAALRERVEGLAAEGRWEALCELLAPLDADRIAGSPGIAYRFGAALYHTGRMRELAEFAATSEAVARRRGDAAGALRALNFRGIAAFELGEIDEARERFAALLELAGAEGNQELMAHATTNLGAVTNLRGEREEAVAYYRLAVPLYERLGSAAGLARAHQNLGLSYRDLGRTAEAADAYRQAESLARGVDHRPLLGMARTGRAELAVLGGDPPLGERLARLAIEDAGAAGDPVTEAAARRVLALALEAADEPARALEQRQRARTLAERAEHPLLLAEIDRDAARSLARAGRAEAAASRFETALERLRRLGARAAAEELERELATVRSRLAD